MLKSFLTFSLALAATLATPQTGPKNPPGDFYAEFPEDPYRKIPREGRKTGPAFRLNGSQFTIRQVNINADGQDILGDAANEPSIVVDPTNPLRMAIGWRQFDTISNNFRQAGYAYTIDGGENWVFPEVIEPGIFRSDPVLDADSEGNFYYNSLTTGLTCQVFKSETGQNTWGDAVQALGGDKQWMAIDRTAGEGRGHIYALWKRFQSSCDGGFTRSTDRGESYEPCTDFPDYPERGTATVGPDGALFICGENGTIFPVSRSTNAQNAGKSVVWDYSVPVDLGGRLALYAGPNPAGLLGQVWIKTNHAPGPHFGEVYLLSTVDQTATTADPAEIIFARSTDGGFTWSNPLKINTNDAPGDWNWFGSMDVAPNGRIDVTWVDTRENPGTYLSNLFYSYSLDGGRNWSENERLSEAFDPHLGFPNQQKIGDYYHMVSNNAGAHLAWAATFNGGEDVFYSRILPDLPSATEEIGTGKTPGDFFLQNAPNPFREGTHVRFSLSKTSRIRLEIRDLHGRLLRILVADERAAGEHSIFWDGRNGAGAEVSPGFYFGQIFLENGQAAGGRFLKN